MAAELTAVFVVQMMLIVALVRLDRTFALGGNLNALVGAVFVILPVVVLDRTGKPYKRYGISAGRPLRDIAFAFAAMAICFPPIALCAAPAWGLSEPGCFRGAPEALSFLPDAVLGLIERFRCQPDWSFHWPEGYPGVAINHFIVVALPEELFYRGYIMGRLDDIFRGRRRLLGADIGVALPIQAVLFALGHYLVDFNPGRLAVFFPALAFGWMKARLGAIGGPIVFHAASNIFMEVFRAGFGLR